MERQGCLDEIVDVENDFLTNFEESHFLEKIIYCKSEGKCTRAYFFDGNTMLVPIHLRRVEELLPKSSFYRVNEVYVVNSKFVKIDGSKREKFFSSELS